VSTATGHGCGCGTDADADADVDTDASAAPRPIDLAKPKRTEDNESCSPPKATNPDHMQQSQLLRRQQRPAATATAAETGAATGEKGKQAERKRAPLRRLMAMFVVRVSSSRSCGKAAAKWRARKGNSRSRARKSSSNKHAHTDTPTHTLGHKKAK